MQSFPLLPLDAAPRVAGDPAATGQSEEVPPGSRGLPATETRPFALLGVLWEDPAAGPPGTVRVMTRAVATGEWSAWQDLDPRPAHAPDADSAEAGDAGVRGGTAPLWTGFADAVRVRVVPRAGDPAPALPAGLRLELVDPGDGSGATPPATEPGPATEHRERPAAADGHTAPRPPVTSRAGWGADESLGGGGPVYTDSVKTVFVHHTAGSNAPTCAETPAVLRGIHRYHVESQGWRDIGYNFLVDACGTIYEGRAGGVAEPVRGAHTLGFNHNSMGVAVLGSHDATPPGPAVREALAALAAWKLGLYGGDPLGSRDRTSGGGTHPAGTTLRMMNVSGHRDGTATDCPGDGLYGDLPAVREAAARAQGR
ncbi:peptidoglycan recognition protein family protein [Streptomyces marincola]|uniref:peptidoglycan recognition protein family protein n=1 Tax=Streptomyces marincola TaxID=2878388 RepID=UPI001CF231AE|nr:N-acetylmuramoyl-L-alanine amidase [Streptomyces marincola]UCM88406.1 N-acetylmuramoyl-L-alanine amidase [Streptomyces marincola]